MSTEQKTLGQIAWEIETEGYGWQWSEAHDHERAHWERIAQAVAESEREHAIKLRETFLRMQQEHAGSVAALQARINELESRQDPAADKEIPAFLGKVRATCKATLSVPPGTAVDIDPAVVAEMHKFMRDEPSVFDRIAMQDVVSLAAYIENIEQKDSSKDNP